MIDPNPYSPKRLSHTKLREMQQKYAKPKNSGEGLILAGIEAELKSRNGLTAPSPAVR